MSLSCAELERLLPELMDGGLSADVQGAAVEHLATCDACSAVVNELEGVGELFREHGRHRLSAEARGRILEALESEAGETM